MHVKDLPGWGEDPDLESLDPDWPVTIGLVEAAEDSGWRKETVVEAYREAFVDGLPVDPVVMCGDLLVTGAHRRAGAARAGRIMILCWKVDPS